MSHIWNATIKIILCRVLQQKENKRVTRVPAISNYPLSVPLIKRFN